MQFLFVAKFATFCGILVANENKNLSNRFVGQQEGSLGTAVVGRRGPSLLRAWSPNKFIWTVQAFVCVCVCVCVREREREREREL